MAPSWRSLGPPALERQSGDGSVTVAERDGRRVLRFQRDDGGGVMEISERAP